MAEKRIARRHRRRLSVKYGKNGAERRGFTEDISETGIFIKGNFVYPPKTIILIEMTLADGTAITLQGRVHWAKKVPPNLMRLVKAGMGVRIMRFLEGEEAYRQLITRLAG